jgi:hypothetical protein
MVRFMVGTTITPLGAAEKKSRRLIKTAGQPRLPVQEAEQAIQSKPTRRRPNMKVQTNMRVGAFKCRGSLGT